MAGKETLSHRFLLLPIFLFFPPFPTPLFPPLFSLTNVSYLNLQWLLVYWWLCPTFEWFYVYLWLILIWLILVYWRLLIWLISVYWWLLLIWPFQVYWSPCPTTPTMRAKPVCQPSARSQGNVLDNIWDNIWVKIWGKSQQQMFKLIQGVFSLVLP